MSSARVTYAYYPNDATPESEVLALSNVWNYPELADSFRLRHRNVLHCSLLVVGRAQVA